MKITICGSMVFLEEMLRIKKDLEDLGHEAKIPLESVKTDTGEVISSIEYHNLRKQAKREDAWVWQRKGEAIDTHFDKVTWSDAILVLNYDKKGVVGYIGGNTLMEIGLAFHLKKKIYFLNDLPEMSYTEELLGVGPVIIHGDLKLIK